MHEALEIETIREYIKGISLNYYNRITEHTKCSFTFRPDIPVLSRQLNLVIAGSVLDRSCLYCYTRSTAVLAVCCYFIGEKLDFDSDNLTAQ